MENMLLLLWDPANHVAVVDAQTFKVIKYSIGRKKSLAVGFL